MADRRLGYLARESSARSKRGRGRWTKEEHEAFLVGLGQCGKDWIAIAEAFVPTRTVTQIRTHAQKYFKKVEQGLPFPEEPYESLNSDRRATNSTPEPESPASVPSSTVVAAAALAAAAREARGTAEAMPRDRHPRSSGSVAANGVHRSVRDRPLPEDFAPPERPPRALRHEHLYADCDYHRPTYMERGHNVSIRSDCSAGPMEGDGGGGPWVDEMHAPLGNDDVQRMFLSEDSFGML